MRISTVTTAGLILASSAAAAALPRSDPNVVSAEEPRGISLGELGSHAEAAFRKGKDPHHDTKGTKENPGLNAGKGGDAKPKQNGRRNEDQVDNYDNTAFGGPDPLSACRMM